MKLILIFVILVSNSTIVYAQGVAIGSNGANPHASAALDIQSTSKGVLIPRVTTDQRNTISSPATGLLVFDTNTGSFWFRSVDNWVELTDTLNAIWKRNGTNAVIPGTGRVGLGTRTPQYDIHIARNNSSIGFTDGIYNQFSGAITADSADLVINAYRRSTLGTGESGNIILQRNSSLPPLTAGNVGIGTSAPAVKLHITGGSDITETEGGYLQMGSTGSINLVADNDEIQAKNNGETSTLYIQNEGGNKPSVGHYRIRVGTQIRPTNSATVVTPQKSTLMTYACINYYIFDLSSVDVYTEETGDGRKDIGFSFVIYKF